MERTEDIDVPACPTIIELERYGKGLLDRPSSEAVRVHLGTCVVCQSSVERIMQTGGAGGTSETSAPDATIETPRPGERRTSPADMNETMVAPGRAGAVDVDATLAAAPNPNATLAVDVTLDAGMTGRDGAQQHYPAIEGYDIRGVLGRGGMGVVYRAVQRNLNRTVALKVLPAALAGSNPNAVSRFRREATAAARLHHTNIIPVYDSGQVSHCYYYAMELIVGEPAFNHFLIAEAKARLGEVEDARAQLHLGEEAMPDELRAQPYVVTFDDGVLWFESADELDQLRNRAEAAIAQASK